MKKILLSASVQRHFFAFHMPYIEWMHENGYEVHIATKLDIERFQEKMNDYPYIQWHQIDFERSPFSKQILVAYQQLKALMKREQYDVIHVHTPVASILGRLAAKKAKILTIVYTAHGFHFYKGASLSSWLIYYPLEKLMARHTDILITMNEQDYQIAKTKFKTRMSNGVFKVNGVGIDLAEYQVSEIKDVAFKESLNIPKDNFVITIIGELNKNKNQIQMIEAVEQLNDETITLVLVGTGMNYEPFKEKYAHNEHIKILGYRSDITKLLNITDVVASMSYREGLPKNVMEAMAAGKPVIATNIRGNQDLVMDGETGYLVPVGDIQATMQAIGKVRNDDQNQLGKNGQERIQDYRIEQVLAEVGEIYGKKNFKSI